jgi:hypothetical protein
MSVILATQEAEIKRITVQSQPRQTETLSQKIPSQKRAGRVVQDVGPEFKPQYCKKKKKEVLERALLELRVGLGKAHKRTLGKQRIC